MVFMVFTYFRNTVLTMDNTNNLSLAKGSLVFIVCAEYYAKLYLLEQIKIINVKSSDTNG
jgi:hypothetical protein